MEVKSLLLEVKKEPKMKRGQESIILELYASKRCTDLIDKETWGYFQLAN